MEIGGPHYRIYGYFDDMLLADVTRYVDAPCDAEMIETVRTMTISAGQAEVELDGVVYNDLFYCDDTSVTLIGTWVGRSNTPGAVWHPDGWAARPTPSKEEPLRYLLSLGRPI